MMSTLSPAVPLGLADEPASSKEVWRRAFGDEPSPEALAALDEAGIEHLRVTSASYFECQELSEANVRVAVSRTLARWHVET